MEEWGGDMSLWVSDFGGVSDEEREMERWRPTVARIFFFNNSFLNFFNYKKKKKKEPKRGRFDSLNGSR